MAQKLIPASASPRRLSLLASAGVNPDKVEPADIDESIARNETGSHLVKRLALSKAKYVYERNPNNFIIGADTIVSAGRRLMGKPSDSDNARAYLKQLSGRRHRVYGGICVISPEGNSSLKSISTFVRFKRLTPAEIDAFILTGQWKDKAGGYAIQGLAGSFVLSINGSYTNIVGLDIASAIAMLTGLGFKRA